MEKIKARREHKKKSYDTNKESAENRRVELLFLDPDESEQVTLSCGPGECIADDCPLYGNLICERRFTRYLWEVKGNLFLFRYRILDSMYKPAKQAEYSIQIKKESMTVPFEQNNTRTDDDGMIIELLPSYTTSLLIDIPCLAASFEVRLMHIEEPGCDSNEQKRGAQQRLHSLGFLSSNVTEDVDDLMFETAVKSFQIFCGENCDEGDSRIVDTGRTDGVLDGPTVESLKKYYGS